MCVCVCVCVCVGDSWLGALLVVFGWLGVGVCVVVVGGVWDLWLGFALCGWVLLLLLLLLLLLCAPCSGLSHTSHGMLCVGLLSFCFVLFVLFCFAWCCCVLFGLFCETDQVRAALLEFHRKYYSANILTVVVRGPGSLNDLERMACEAFGEVPDKNVALPEFSRHGPQYDAAQLPRLVKVEARKEVHMLHLTWCLPPLLREYMAKPEDYLAHLIGHEVRACARVHVCIVYVCVCVCVCVCFAS